MGYWKSSFSSSCFSTILPDYTIVDSNEYVNNSLLEWNTVSFPHVKRIEARYQDLTDSFYREFEAVILLAGQGSVSNSKNMKSVLENNINNFAHLLSLLSSDQKFIYASSSSVYGKTDTFADEGSRFGDPYNFYDLSKQMIDKLAFLSGKCYFGLRFGTVNGYSPNFRNDLMINSL